MKKTDIAKIPDGALLPTNDPGAPLQNLLSGPGAAVSAALTPHRKRYGSLSRVVPLLLRSGPDYRPVIAGRVTESPPTASPPAVCGYPVPPSSCGSSNRNIRAGFSIKECYAL